MTRKKTWQKALSEGIGDLKTLMQHLQLTMQDLPLAQQAQQNFPLKIPKSWIKKIKPADPHDPLLLQVLPVAAELDEVADYELDALQERQASPIPGLLHKYRSRVLLIISGACGINCRYCFRRNFPYAEHQTGQAQWQKALAYIASHPEINEVIFSGGDPLLSSDTALARLTQQLAEIPHVKTLRVHSRLPVFLPERLDKNFQAWFLNKRFKLVLVVHVNHPNEIDEKFARKMRALKKRGVVLLNQSVLLKGVNDNAQILKALSEKLFFDCEIQPYYLNTLDKVKGVAHFALQSENISAIYAELLALLPGYLVPKLITEIPGRPSKVPRL